MLLRSDLRAICAEPNLGHEMILRNFDQASLVLPVIYSEIQLLTDLVGNPTLPKFRKTIIVISSVPIDCCTKLSADLGLKIGNLVSNLFIVCRTHALTPGAARNEGLIFVDTDYIVFLDVRTIPTIAWSAYLDKFIKTSDHDLLLGSVRYSSSTFFGKCFIAATYGFNPLPCLPGLITTQHIFSTVGKFVSLRAGEDVEWITRARLHSLKIEEIKSEPLVEYYLPDANGMHQYIKKWFRNYTSSFMIPLYQSQKYLYLLFIGTIMILFLTSWNWRIAQWDETSSLYIPYISRFSLAAMSMLYIIVRGVVLPVKKGLPLRLSMIPIILYSFLIALCLDIVKGVSSLRSLVDIRKRFWFYK